MEIVVVEREFDESYTLAQIHEIFATASNCHDIYNVTYLHGFLANGGRRMICVYYAPDAEAVRSSSKIAGVPWERAWRADYVRPAKPAASD